MDLEKLLMTPRKLRINTRSPGRKLGRRMRMMTLMMMTKLGRRMMMKTMKLMNTMSS